MLTAAGRSARSAAARPAAALRRCIGRERDFASIRDRDDHSGAGTGVTADMGMERELATMIVEVLALPDVRAEEIEPEAPLFGEGLGLDSIDALEIAVAIAQRYGVQLRADDEITKRVFANLRALARHVEAHRVPPAAL
jgi:acyl carrier protein